MSALDVIRLRRMVFYAYHGQTAAERETGRRFEVDLELRLDLSTPVLTDDLSDTVDYSRLYKVVKRIVEGDGRKLLETLAGAIANAVLSGFAVEEVTVRVRKAMPPLPGTVDFVEVELTRGRDDG
jgi:dihydroneopterin aldolase